MGLAVSDPGNVSWPLRSLHFRPGLTYIFITKTTTFIPLLGHDTLQNLTPKWISMGYDGVRWGIIDFYQALIKSLAF